jgi:hypothetical protein
MRCCVLTLSKRASAATESADTKAPSTKMVSSRCRMGDLVVNPELVSKTRTVKSQRGIRA